MPPGLIVQLPEGNPLSTTLPVAAAQVGWVMLPIVGANGVAGTELITVLDVAGLPVTQVALEVITTEITSPLAGT